MVESMSAREGTVRLQLNSIFRGELEQVLLVQEGMEFDLVHGGGDRCWRGELFGGGDCVGTYARRAGEPPIVGLEESLPRFVSPARDRAAGEGPSGIMQ